MKRLVATALVALATSTSAAGAATWELIGQMADGKVYLDTANMVAVGDVRTAWARLLHNQPVAVGGKQATATHMLVHFNCKDGATAPLLTVLYGDEKKKEVLKGEHAGAVIFTPDVEGSFSYVARFYACTFTGG